MERGIGKGRAGVLGQAEPFALGPWGGGLPWHDVDPAKPESGGVNGASAGRQHLHLDRSHLTQFCGGLLADPLLEGGVTRTLFPQLG